MDPSEVTNDYKLPSANNINVNDRKFLKTSHLLLKFPAIVWAKPYEINVKASGCLFS